MKETNFKMTEIGLIPQDWEVKLLGKIGAFSKGKGISRSESNSGKNPAIRYGELYTKHNNVISEFGSYISNDVALTSKQLKYGDILFAASGETKEEIGKSAAFVSTCESYAGGDIIICSPFFTESSLFLGFALNYPLVQKQKAMFGQGDAIVHITTDNLKKVKLIYPPLFEQTRIASALSEVDALLSSLDKVIAKKQAIKEGTMQQLLTGKTRLEVFDGEWKEYELKDISDRYDNLRIPVSESNRQRGETPYYGATGIQDYVKGYTHNGEYVLLAEDGASDTRKYPIQYISGKAWVNNHAHVIQSKNDLCNNCFLYYVLKIVDFTESVSGSSRIKLNAEAMEKIKVTIPTSVDEQKCIVSILTSMDSELSALQAKRKKYEAIKQGMMQQLLTGKVRLI